MQIEDLIALVLKDAHIREENAGYSGQMHDGGAERLRDQVKFFRYGLTNTQPPEWENYKVQLDPEYQTYLKLKSKFG